MENLHDTIESFEQEFYNIKIINSIELEKYYSLIQNLRYELFESFKKDTNFGLSEYFILIVNKPDKSKYNYDIFLKYLESLERINNMCLEIDKIYYSLDK